MSARVLNPAMMSEMGHRGMVGSTRVSPSRVALARVRRDLFGPVDHTAARALAERELRAQSLLDAERWGFDFSLEIPRENSRYDWKPVKSEDIIPEPYALRGMPYIRKNAPGTPRKCSEAINDNSGKSLSVRKRTIAATTTTTTTTTTSSSSANVTPITVARKAERTPPQEPRVPDIGDTSIIVINNVATDDSEDGDISGETYRRKKIKCIVEREPTTPVLNASMRKQTSITDYMKSRKRGLNGSTKSIVELPEKIARNAGHIRS